MVPDSTGSTGSIGSSGSSGSTVGSGRASSGGRETTLGDGDTCREEVRERRRESPRSRLSCRTWKGWMFRKF